MAEYFPFDVFLSHSSHDGKVVRDIAQRLRADGIKVWFDEWEIRPGDSIPAKVEAGLEQSRILVLCMSANAFGSEWAQLESGTFRFRDPQDKAHFQLEYVAKYVRERALGAKSAAIERYIDRDFIEDYSAFHARDLEPVTNHCRRVHFFPLEAAEAKRKLAALRRIA